MENSIIRLFTRPKSWRAKGNLEFEELLLLCLFQKPIAEPEILKRHAATRKDYQSAGKTQVILMGIMSQLAAALIALLVLHLTVAVCTVAASLSAPVTLLILANKRARVLWDNMNDCYAWLLREILHPTACEIPPDIAAGFGNFCGKNDEPPARVDQKLKRMITGFGYTITTIEN